MRTSDFSRAPLMGQATAQFVGGTSFRHPLALVGLYRRWRPMLKRLKASDGYRGHRVWFHFPFTFGTIAFFSDREALMIFARSPEHADLMQWVMKPGNAHGGFIRIWEVNPDGYSSGIWRAEEPHLLKAIEQFTPLPGEENPPLVAHRARHARRSTPAR
ncbi:MAG: hypothetical protein NVS2B16_15510 [Chloroflexota bacterium]